MMRAVMVRPSSYELRLYCGSDYTACGNQGIAIYGRTASEPAEIASRAGWALNDGGKNICPECSKGASA